MKTCFSTLDDYGVECGQFCSSGLLSLNIIKSCFFKLHYDEIKGVHRLYIEKEFFYK